MTIKEIHDRIDELYKNIEYEELYDGFTSDFCWELSEDVFDVLIDGLVQSYYGLGIPFDYNSTVREKKTLCGYPVLVNTYDKEVIRLWKSVRA